MKKLFSLLLLIAAIVIALGGFGHSLSGVAPVQQALTTAAVDPHVSLLILAVWHFAGMAMVMLGLIALWQWREVRGGRQPKSFPLYLIALSYLVYGVAAMLFTGSAFFSIFTILGVAVLASTYFLTKAMPA